jgi:dTDP-4-dehydrorhamnose reductase
MEKQQKVLITGAGGQLGSELTQGLWRLHGKENVLATDIKQSGGTLSPGHFQTLDVLNKKELSDLLVTHNITQIYHLAAVL